ncbi:GntR family transcriptional regulator [Paenibacillus sp. 1001270B_150601_E10]|uniref:GntR family transcriptional regulator n=1 Tax=Paenibacillus sp. 1001270B_150601_E10 TaxID=2787079 RepID=UPI002B4BA8F0|nr:GntR family transcriptional regulator [Paenibacillus sp. 1001270B_150601_E10]
MKLSRNKRPLYVQIMNIIKERILHGVYPLGTNIPSEPQLEEEFNVSKITVRNAIIELVQEGYLEKSSGKGTKVIRNTSVSKLSKWKRFTEVLVEEGHQIRKRLIRADIVTNEEGSGVHQLFGERCLCIERMYDLDGKPYIHYTHYVTNQLASLDLSDLDSQSLYERLEEHSISLGKYRDEFAVAPVPRAVREALLVEEGALLLKRSRYSYDEAGELIEYSEGYYNTAMHSYVVNYDI